jgi:hypothetical protein
MEDVVTEKRGMGSGTGRCAHGLLSLRKAFGDTVRKRLGMSNEKLKKGRDPESMTVLKRSRN